MTQRIAVILLVVAVSWFCGAGTVNAANITSIGAFSLPGFSTGSIGPVGATTAPNNDNATGTSPNAVPATVFLNTLGPIEIEFVLAASGGTTEYGFTQALFNITDQPWSDFHLELGFGTGPGFVRSGEVDGLDFDVPGRDPAPTASAFTVQNHQSDTIDWQGGNVAVFGSLLTSFAIDVPDGLEAINPSGLNRFTLRAAPSVGSVPGEVPEPGTLIMLVSGVAGLVAQRQVGQRRASRRH
jgi:hypothetical protein